VKKNKVVIGTRGSKLALWQAEWIKSELKRLYPALDIELNKIKTTGDKILDVPLAQVGGKGLFVKEIEEAMLRNEADIAVHSMKDVPTEFPEGLHLAVICRREDPKDALIISEKLRVKGEKGTKSLLYALPEGVRVGTSSLRRSCQLLSIRPDLKIEQLRGNLDTRLRKLDEGQFDAIILAAAGIKRLGLSGRITEVIPLEISLPAIGQGAVGIECRINDEFIHGLIEPLNHPSTSLCVKAERAFLRRLEGGCQVPIAAHARLKQIAESKGHRAKGNRSNPFPHLEKGGEAGFESGRQDGTIDSELLVIDGLVGSISGDRIIEGHIEGKPEQAEHLGVLLAEDLLLRGAKEILDEVYKKDVAAVNGEISS
jgi:hydroxymethylbilane synthase